MKVLGLDGCGYRLKNGDRLSDRPRSRGHRQARQLLQELFPFDSIWEEVFLPGCLSALYLDFLLPSRLLAVEVQGPQHQEYVEHFHKDEAGFRKSQLRDRNKMQFCQENRITLVQLESDDECRWRRKIIQAIFGEGRSD